MRSKFTVKYVENKLNEYCAKSQFQTFKGALLYIGLFGDDLNDMMRDAEDGGIAAKQIIKMLNRYKFALEVKMEEWLIYQDKHPDLKGVKFFNYKNIEFLLKCSNRTYYDNGIVNAAKALPKKEVQPLPANTTEVKLWSK